MHRTLCFLLTLALCVTTLSFRVEARPPAKVLGMHVEGDELSLRDKEDIFTAIQMKLKAYPDVSLIQPPEGDLLDLMIELECIDIDADCLGRLGARYGADKVFYAQVDKAGGFTLLVRIVNVADKSLLRDRTTTVPLLSALPGVLETEIIATFGEPPPPKPTTGELRIRSTAGARILVKGEHGEVAGTGRIKATLAPGEYTVRATRDGYREAMIKVKVVAGKTTKKTLKLKFIPVATPPAAPLVKEASPPSGTTDALEFYESWWFWTVVGAVVVTGVSLGTAAGLGAFDATDSSPTGDLRISVDRNRAWNDVTLRGQGP